VLLDGRCKLQVARGPLRLRQHFRVERHEFRSEREVELLWSSVLPHPVGSKAHREDVTGAIATGSGEGKGTLTHSIELVPQHRQGTGHLAALSRSTSLEVSQERML
jgi:hypothetical protein